MPSERQMNKINRILLATLGGMDVAITVLTPILLSVFWIIIFGLNTISYIFLILCGLSSLFRAIKVGWMKR